MFYKLFDEDKEQATSIGVILTRIRGPDDPNRQIFWNKTLFIPALDSVIINLNASI